MRAKSITYMRFGSHRVPFMVIKEGADGSEYVIFPMDRTGFKISVHPRGKNPHMRDTRTFYQELDLSALHSVNWDEMAAKEFQPWWESRFYWPSHRADLIAIPGPPGKTWVEGFQELFHGDEFDAIEMLKAALGHGTIFKIGYRERKAFFETSLGQGSIIIDPRECRFGFFFAHSPYPDRPLFGLRWDEKGFDFPMPGPLRAWKDALDYRLEVAIEEYVESAEDDLEAGLVEILPELKKFVDDFRVVRWKPEPSSGRSRDT